MSSEYAELLLKRAKMFLESAEVNFSDRRFDVAAVEAEISAQLALKALIVKQGLEPLRTHAIRQLLSFIIDNRLLPSNILERVEDFARSNRERLIILERARAAGQYGLLLVDYDEAEVSINCARGVMDLVEKHWRLLG